MKAVMCLMTPSGISNLYLFCGCLYDLNLSQHLTKCIFTIMHYKLVQSKQCTDFESYKTSELKE